MATLQAAEHCTERASVLVVDDERGPREALRRILEPSCDVLTAQSGSAALDLLDSSAVDVATIDLSLPDVRGDELVRRLRSRSPEIEFILTTGCASLESALDGIRLGVADYLIKPFDAAGVRAAVAKALARRGEKRGAEESAQAIDSVALLAKLAERVERPEPHRAGHARRVAFLCAVLGDRLGLARSECDDLRLAGFLHDVGKASWSHALLTGERDLDPEERHSLERHSASGAHIARAIGLPEGIASAIRHHHERWDGKGYPARLAGDAIPLAARIVAIADAFDAMTAVALPGSRSPRQALEELCKHAGSQFDPVLVREIDALVGAAEDALAAPAQGHDFRG